MVVGQRANLGHVVTLFPGEWLSPLRYETTHYCRDITATIDMVKTRCDEAEAQNLTSIPLTDNTVKLRIDSTASNQ